jgi:tetratricopeptide (TPR) repeat protein
MEQNSQKQKRFEALFRRGTEMLHRGNTERAMQLLERAYQIDKTHVDTAVNLSGAYILHKKFKQAVEILEPISRQEPDHAMVWINLGAAYLGNPILARDEEHLRAIDAFKKALAINPIAPHVAYNLGLIYRDRGELAEAIHWFGRAIQANPNDQDARRIKARLQASLANSN